MEVNCLQ